MMSVNEVADTSVERKFVSFCAAEERLLLKAINERDVRTMSYAALELSRVVQMYLNALGSFPNGVEICNKLLTYSNLLNLASENKLDFPDSKYRFFSESLKEAAAYLMKTAAKVQETVPNKKIPF